MLFLLPFPSSAFPPPTFTPKPHSKALSTGGPPLAAPGHLLAPGGLKVCPCLSPDNKLQEVKMAGPSTQKAALAELRQHWGFLSPES